MTNYKELKQKAEAQFLSATKLSDMRFYLLTISALETGARVSDLLKLSFSDIIENEIHYLNHKSNKHQEQRITDNLKSFINRFKETLIVCGCYNDKIFYNASKGAVLSRVTANRRSQKEFKINFHQLRKESGKNICSQLGVVYASKFLGHSKVSTTDIYLGTSKDEFKKVMNTIVL